MNKIISEYIKLNCEGKKWRKNKKFKSALEYYIKCFNLVNDTDFIEKKCKSYFRLGQCNLKINHIKKSYEHFLQCDNILNKVDKDSFPFLKVKGQLSANMILLKYAIEEDNTSAICYIKEFIHDLEGLYKLEEKLSVFYHFIKELFSLINYDKKVESFLDCYQSAKNEILFNHQKYLCSSLKSSFQVLMNNSINQILLEKNHIMYYNAKYSMEENHPLINFLAKNNDIIKESNISKAKGCLDSFLKNNKIKLPMTSIEIIQDRKNRIEGFNELYGLLSGSFNAIFKNSFSLTPIKNNENKIFIAISKENNIHK